jgi:hypothetical protein
MGMGMAQTMANAMSGMNQQPPQQAPAAAPPPPPAPTVWHVAENGETKGPFSEAQLQQMLAEGAFGRDTLVWTSGQDGWKKAGDVPGLSGLFASMPPPPPPPPPAG